MIRAFFRYIRGRLKPPQDDDDDNDEEEESFGAPVEFDDSDNEEEFFGAPIECHQTNSRNVWPTPRSGHRMCADSNYLYVFGGYDAKQNNALYPELWRYNITTEKWTKLPDEEEGIPKECLSSSMLLWRRKIIVFGGTGYPFAHDRGDKMYIYCLKSYKWTHVDNTSSSPSGNEQGNSDDEQGDHAGSTACCQCVKRRVPGSSPRGKYGHSMALCERTGDVYIFSGTQGFDAIDEFHKFNLMTMKWEKLQFCPYHDRDLPSARYRHEAVSSAEEFYIFGGSTLPDPDNIADDITYKTVHSFDFKKFKWMDHLCLSSSKVTFEDHEVHEIPEPRKAHSCVLLGDSVYMVGGRHNETNGLLDDIWKFSLKEKLWTKAEHVFPFKISFHASAVTTQGCMYVFGGTDALQVRSNKLHKMWLCAPTLKEQAWMKIVCKLRRVGRLTKQTLAEMGVPSNFFHRLDDSFR